MVFCVQILFLYLPTIFFCGHSKPSPLSFFILRNSINEEYKLILCVILSGPLCVQVVVQILLWMYFVTMVWKWVNI